ncbi:MAG: hypothetical protein WAN35_12030 [Terracidiphilus sp.]
MHFDLLSILGVLCFGAPALAFVVILAHYHLRRISFRRNRRRGKRNWGYYPSSIALGSVLQFMQANYQPSVEYVIEEKQHENADEDDEGDPENLKKQLDRQLKNIRRGEHVDRLVLRL